MLVLFVVLIKVTEGWKNVMNLNISFYSDFSGMLAYNCPLRQDSLNAIPF